MAEFYDAGFNLQTLLNLWNNTFSSGDSFVTEGKEAQEDISTTDVISPRKTISPASVEVRPSICVTGLDKELILRVKNLLSSLTPEPLPLESFHVKNRSDIQDGALLVPKVVLVARHCAGKLLIDEEGDNGQLDFIYDELVETGTDVMLIYVGLPKAIYPSMKHMIYHPRMIDIVFPSQPILREFAEENCLVTTVADKDFTNMQKNVIREWINKPVKPTHPVYEHAAYLSRCSSSLSQTYDDASFWSETEVYQRKWGEASDYRHNLRGEEHNYVSATEEHPLASKKKKKKSKLFKIKQKLALKSSSSREAEYRRFTEESSDMMDENVEMEMYRQTGYMPRSLHELDV